MLFQVLRLLPLALIVAHQVVLKVVVVMGRVLGQATTKLMAV
jgi:hypothetical protein